MVGCSGFGDGVGAWVVLPSSWRVVVVRWLVLEEGSVGRLWRYGWKGAGT